MKAFFLVLMLSALVACERREGTRTDTGAAMGTTWRLVQSDARSSSQENLIKRVLAEQEDRFSNWDECSEVSQIERGEREPSEEMRRLLELAEAVKGESGGAFDIAWEGGLDLGGIAKGWAVDRVAEELRKEGLRHFVFELGGEVVARGNGPDGDGWEVGIERPIAGRTELVKILRLYDEALATSGNYRQPKHLKDGRTGEALGGDFRSVSVVMPTCAEADAWSTALFVLEAEPDGFTGKVFRH